MKKIPVLLGEKSYDILIGKNAVENLTGFLTQKNYSKVFIITDENVAKLHLARLKSVLEKNKIKPEIIIEKSGEKTKSFKFLEKTCEKILAKNIDRKSLIIAFGGGVIGDLSGFIAAILLRGIDFIQIPTTLLAAVDSSVGGKTAINSKSGKNLIGSFYQPKMVICDLNFLETLPAREFRAGYAEIVKYGFIFDKDFFEFLEKNHKKIFNFDDEVLEKIITRSCEIKAEIVGRDEKESGERALLNFGHTFGHIFETETKYSNELLHGEAVALGMVMAAKMSQNFGMISQNDFLRIKSHLENCGFVTNPKKIRKKWNEKNLIKHLYKDKKNENRNLTFILLEKLGKAVIKKSVPLQEFEKVLREFLIANW
jgi:3-dehydroquinate synthase